MQNIVLNCCIFTDALLLGYKFAVAGMFLRSCCVNDYFFVT